MKASIKLMVGLSERKNGYMVIVEIADKNKRKRKCIGYSFLNDWNQEKQIPYKHHSKYHYFLPVVLEYHAKINKINYGGYTFAKALDFIFGVEEINKPKEKLRFYELCVPYCSDTSNGKLYKTVLNSFNKLFPGIAVDDIDSGIAACYMDFILKHQQPNGVHTYMRTLTALFTKVSLLDNPFKGIRPKKVKTANKALTETDLKKIIHTRTFKHKFDSHNTNDTINHYRYIWLLLFYLGGIDIIDLASLRYDKHVVENRIQFNRNKGGTSVFVNNLIVPQASKLLRKFDCKPYLVPIYKYKSHNDFVSNMNDRLTDRLIDLKLTKRPLTKSARYTFITRAQKLLIDERITVEIVGHAQQKTHSIYTDEFNTDVRDAAHLKIVTI